MPEKGLLHTQDGLLHARDRIRACLVSQSVFCLSNVHYFRFHYFPSVNSSTEENRLRGTEAKDGCVGDLNSFLSVCGHVLTITGLP